MNISRERFGSFDYIIAHGLFSWVPDFVRRKILRIFSECLEAHGIGYISYNTYPGCRIREMVWGAMHYYTAGGADPLEKVRAGIAAIETLSEAAETGSAYQSILKSELAGLKKRWPANVFHDDLSSVNQPFYFHEFVDQITQFGLQFLSEVEITASHSGKLNREARKILDSLRGDVIRREQYLDFIECCSFRSTLICRTGIQLNREPEPDILTRFRLASQVRPEPENPNIMDPAAVKFVGSTGASLETNHPLTKAALIHLTSVWPRSVPFDDMIAEAAKIIEANRADLITETEKMSAHLVQMFQAGFIKLHLFQPPIVTEAGEFPLASAFTRLQIEQGFGAITTMTGLNLKSEDEYVRPLLILLDGTRDRPAISADFLKTIEIPANEKEAFEAKLPAMIEFYLVKFGEAGFLVA